MKKLAQTGFSDMSTGVDSATTVKNPILGNLNSLSGSDFLSQFIPKSVGLLFIFGAVAFFFMLLFGALSYILSGGDKAHVESAKARITSALVGIVLLLGSFAIVKLVETFFGVDILSIDIGPLVIQ